MSLGLYVEGRSDKDTIPILIRKLGHRLRIITKAVSQSELLIGDKMARHLTVLLRERHDVDLVLICIDSERVDPSVTKERSRTVERMLNRDSPVPVRYAIVDHALEGWLACDEEAIQSALGPRARINIQGNPDDHPTPAGILRGVYRENGRKFRKTRDNPIIAERVRPVRISQRSSTFRVFEQLLEQYLSG